MRRKSCPFTDDKAGADDEEEEEDGNEPSFINDYEEEEDLDDFKHFTVNITNSTNCYYSDVTTPFHYPRGRVAYARR